VEDGIRGESEITSPPLLSFIFENWQSVIFVVAPGPLVHGDIARVVNFFLPDGSGGIRGTKNPVDGGLHGNWQCRIYGLWF
jgi:hypothetical protein